MAPPKVLLIDNVDSFTYNVADLLHRVLGCAPTVWHHAHPAGLPELLDFDAIVVGPGPGRPQVDTDMLLSDVALRQDEVPVLGVCLGHQGMAHVAGDAVAEMALTRHGIISAVEHDGTGIFEGVPSPFEVVRYHSLEVPEPLVSALRVTARALDDGSVMGLAAPGRRQWGVQFHPESVLSQHGETIVANFLRLAGVPVTGRFDPDCGPVAVGDALAAHPAAAGGRPVSVQARRFAGPVDDWSLRELLVGDSPSSVWLDASDGSGWSLVVDASGPLAFDLTHHVGEGPPLLDRLDEELGHFELVGEAPPVPFTWRPGFVGWWGYELKAETGGTATHPSPWPDAWLTFADRGVVIDHASGDVWAVWLEDEAVADEQASWADEVGQAIRRAQADRRGQTDRTRLPAQPDASPRSTGRVSLPNRTRRPAQPDASPCTTGRVAASPAPPRPRDDEASYVDKVRRAQQEIARGETYEVCLTTTWTATGTGLGEADLYRAMRQVSPVPHGCWLRTPQVSVLGCSPERFVSVDGQGIVEARPIKGTRPRGATLEEDAALVEDLATAVKDRAENLMIVDLLRNDLHRVCRAGSVHVPEIFAVESYATVHQLVSTVRGQLADGMEPTDVLRACFPGGSMTGAPKVRTMEILDGLEGEARGIYSGAIGWIGLDGSMDTSIVIRTVTWADGEVTFGVGGAVTALSDPAEEHAEMVTKAQSVLRAMALAAQDKHIGQPPAALDRDVNQPPTAVDRDVNQPEGGPTGQL